MSHVPRQEIRVLENKLDKAMIKYNEAQSIRKTYDQIVQRLQVRLRYLLPRLLFAQILCVQSRPFS